MKYLAIIPLSLLMIGCADKATEYKVQLVPTPQQCDVTIPYEPEINTGDLAAIAKSLKDLAFDSKEMRRIMREIPCLNLTYKDSNNE